MSEYLYVCHFSNGHIKVGRSVSPKSRIASHADRVACLGVELVEHHIVECVGKSSEAETILIEYCSESAKKRNRSEWFEGLDYLDACDAANKCGDRTMVHHKKPKAQKPVSSMNKQEAIDLLGGSPKKAAEAMGYTSAHAVYMWPDKLSTSVANQVRGVVSQMAARQPELKDRVAA